ncbi:hypothetical protein C8J57DRAFT_1476837 [Mycena rebaudengoi]|nr:hypothetical protein C8J57DRAFT_1476837 [Mycena rebaudengoi]
MDETPSSPTAAPPTETTAHPMSDEPARVLDALKPKALPTTDKETTFWNAYKTLSEEHDREFHKKYGTDLDTSLIFSAFIIQIQPELQQDPNEVTQQLLRILIHNANQSLFSGIDMAETNNGATTTITIVQSFLYASLFSTLLAALLAVLGKQWLMHYDAAGSRGTLAERGLERQRKYDGLQRWKFTLVMEMFPLLLQLALLLFSTALSVYLLTISRPIAMIVITLTSLGTLAYISQLVSAAVYPDSPFQTPLCQCFAQPGHWFWETVLASPADLRQFLQGLSGTWTAIWKFLQQPPIVLPLPLFQKNSASNDEDTDPLTSNPLSAAPLPEPTPAVTCCFMAFRDIYQP